MKRKSSGDEDGQVDYVPPGTRCILGDVRSGPRGAGPGFFFINLRAGANVH